MVFVSTKSRMYARIMEAMPQDAEVQEYCKRHIDKIQAGQDKTKTRLDMAMNIAMRYDDVDNPVCAKVVASKVNTDYGLAGDDRWTTRTASYYLNQLVKDGKMEVAEEPKSPKSYYYIG